MSYNKTDNKNIYSPLLFDDVNSYKFTSNDFITQKNGEVVNFNYDDSNCFCVYDNNDQILRKYYVLNNENKDNYMYKSFAVDSKISIIATPFANNIFFINDDLIKTEYNHNVLSSLKTTTFTGDDASIYYDYPRLDTLFTTNDLIYNPNSNENYIYFYVSIRPDERDRFLIDDYVYELRINNIPTNFFEVKKLDTSNGTSTSVHKLQLKINRYAFSKRTSDTNLDTFILTIKNKYTGDNKSFKYSNYSDFIDPFVSYNPMTETTDDVTINCRFDISLETENQTNDITIDIANPNLLKEYENEMRPIIDDNIVVKMIDRNINLRALTATEVTLEFNGNISSNDRYLISKNEMNFEEESYKVYTKDDENTIQPISDTDTFLFKLDRTNPSNNTIKFIVESTTDTTAKLKKVFSIRFFKLTDDAPNDKNILFTQHKTVITVNFNLTINPDIKYEFTKEEEEILSNITSFPTDTVTTFYGRESLISIKANDNIELMDSDLNSEELIEYINAGNRDLEYINSRFLSFDLKIYGIYVDHMVMADSNVGEIFLRRFDNITSTSLYSSNEVKVCNVLENGNPGDNCKDGFNENAFTVTVGDIDRRIVIVPEFMYNTFNYLNGSQYMGDYTITDSTEEIFDLSTEEYLNEFDAHDGKKFICNYAFYPYADLKFITNEDEENDFKSTNLYIDYYPVMFRVTKTSDDNIVWTLYNGEKVSSLQVEKIIKLIAEKNEEEDPSVKSVVDESRSTIDDSNSTIIFPSFVSFKILMDTENGDTVGIDDVKYTGLITNQSDLPIAIHDISMANFSPDEGMFVVDPTDDSKLDPLSFMFYDLEGNINYIKTDRLKIGEYLDHNTITTLEGNIFVIKPGGSIKVNIYNNTDIRSIPSDFGVDRVQLEDSLRYNIYYLVENTDSDSDIIKYTFRETGQTKSTNMETVIDVYPLISENNFDTEYFRYGQTVLNIITPYIVQRSVAFRLIDIKQEVSEKSDPVNYEKFMDDVTDGSSAYHYNEIYYADVDVAFLDMKDIYFLESGKDYSYRSIINKLKAKYAGDPDRIDHIEKAYGLQVIARTKYSTDDKGYNMAVISNFSDVLTNRLKFLPRLNRLTGSIYHKLKILNKSDEYYDYKIIVDDKEYKDGDIIYNKYANENALHKFRLYYKPKYSIPVNEDILMGIGSPFEYNGETYYVGNFNLKLVEVNGHLTEVPYIFDRDGYHREYKAGNNNVRKQSTERLSYSDKTYIETNVDDETTLNIDDGDDNSVGFSDTLCLKEYIEQLALHPDYQPSELALRLGDFNKDGIIDQTDLEILKNAIKTYGILMGDVNVNGKLDQTDATWLLRLMLAVDVDKTMTMERFIDKNDGAITNDRTVYMIDSNQEDRSKFSQTDATWILRMILVRDVFGGPTDYRPTAEFGNCLANKYVLRVPYVYSNNYNGTWILADSFEGCIDGTKPLVPELLIPDGTEIKNSTDVYKEAGFNPIINRNVLHKFTTITRDDLKKILYNPNNILNEVTYYKNVNILSDISNNMKYLINGEAGISSLKVPSMTKDPVTEEPKYIVMATNEAEGKFQIVNNTNEKLNVEINQRKISSEISYPFTITSDAVLKNTTYVNDYQPIFTIEPNTTLNVFIKFTSDFSNTGYETGLDIRVQNNYKKSYKDNNIKWDHYHMFLNYVRIYDINFDLIKDLLPYKFYVEDETHTDDYEIANYYNELQTELFNILDVNNFNRNSLYSSLIFLDDTLIYDSLNTSTNVDTDYSLLIPEKILDRKLYIGDHTLTVITNKFNGLLNYKNYYISIIDHNIYNESKKNYFKDRTAYYENYLKDKTTRKSIIPRHPMNENYSNEEYLNELFLDSNGNISMVAKDYSSKSDKFYLYKFTEIIQHYMNFSKYLVDSNQYLCEKNSQEIISYYRATKEQYDEFSNNIYGKLDKSIGELYTLIDSIEYNFDNFDSILADITEKLKTEEENEEPSTQPQYTLPDQFISRLFYNDDILYKYKNFNIIYPANILEPSVDASKFNIELKLVDEITDTFYNDYKDTNYIFTNGRNISISKSIYVMPFEPNISNSTNYQVIDNTIAEVVTKNSSTNTLIFNTKNAYNAISNLDIGNYKFYVLLNINNESTYALVFTLYNIKSALSLDTSDNIRFSYREIVERTVTNNTDFFLTFKLTLDNSDLPICNSSISTPYNGLSINSKIISVYSVSDLGYFEDNTVHSNKIVLPPHSSCKLIFKGDVESPANIETLNSNIMPKELNTTYNIISSLNANNQTKILNKKLKIEVTDINSNNDDLYKTIHTELSNLNYETSFMYSAIAAFFLSTIKRSKKIYRKLVHSYSSSDNSVLLLINDIEDSTTVAGNFFTNGFKNIEDNQYSYFPFRENKVIKLSGDDRVSSNPNRSVNTYNDRYSIEKFTDSSTLFTATNIFPIIISKVFSDTTNPSYSFTLNFINTVVPYRNFENIDLHKPTDSSNDIIYNRTIDYITNMSYVCEGTVLETPADPNDYYMYGQSLDNNVEYITTRMYDKNYGSDILFYIYPYYDNTSPTLESSMGTSIVGENVHFAEGIYDIDLDDIVLNENSLYTYDTANIQALYKAFNSENTAGYNYYKLLNSVNSISDSAFIIIENGLLNFAKSIYSIKSNIATIQQNIVNQNRQLENKLSVKEFKEWINKNIFNLAEYEYNIMEIFSDIYSLSNKGLSDFSYTVTPSGSSTQQKMISLRDSYPLINIDRNYLYLDYYIEGQYSLARHHKGDVIDPDYCDRANILISEYDRSEISHGAENGVGCFYCKKYWVTPDESYGTIASIHYKKNFIETSKLYDMITPYPTLPNSLCVKHSQ